MADWIEWKGGECQVDDKTRVDVKFRDGLVSEDDHASVWGWDHMYGKSDIVAYRICDPIPEIDASLEQSGRALVEALTKYGFPMSDEAWCNTGDDAPVKDRASVEARALHRAATALINALAKLEA